MPWLTAWPQECTCDSTTPLVHSIMNIAPTPLPFSLSSSPLSLPPLPLSLPPPFLLPSLTPTLHYNYGCYIISICCVLPLCSTICLQGTQLFVSTSQHSAAWGGLEQRCACVVSDNATFLLESFPLSLPLLLLVVCMHTYACPVKA